MMIRVLACIVSMTALWPGFAAAQNPVVIETIKGFDAKAPQPAPDLIAAAVTKAAIAVAAGGGCTPDGVDVIEVTPITGARIILRGVIQKTLRNAWSVYARDKGCPNAAEKRYALIQFADDGLQAEFINTGRSNANLSIMRDTSPGAAAAALNALRRAKSGCTGADMQMVETRVASEQPGLGPDGVRYKGMWVEIWAFRACGRTAEVPVEFTADGDGGAYTHIKGDAVKLLPKTSG